MYCAEVWGCAKSVHLFQLKLIQKKIVSYNIFKKINSYSSYIQAIKYTAFRQINFHKIGLFTYKIHHNMYPSVLKEMYVQNHNIYDYNTRQNPIL